MPFWEPEKELEGKTIAILGGGPSLLDAPFDLLRENAIPMIAVNNAYELAPDAWALVGSDMLWWLTHPEARAFKGYKITLQEGASDRDMMAYPIRDKGIGRNSALHAAYVAIDAGAAKILLFGVDLDDKDMRHWHPEHAAPLRGIRPDDFTNARAAWARLAERGDRPPILNCSPRSALRCFPLVADLAEELTRP